MTNSTRVKFGNRKRNSSKRAIPLSALNKRRREIPKKHFKTNIKHTFFAVTAVLAGLFLIIYFLFATYLQTITVDLPSPEKPFGKKDTTSQIFDRNGVLLYRMFNDEDRDPVKIADVPALVKWTFLAAEDINFYNHPGIDVIAIARCGIRILDTNEVQCGASTVTQQLIRKTSLTDDVSIDRKIKEMILALTIERQRTKEEILEMYFTIIPEGSNIYGLTRGAKFYFNKKPAELTLAEAAILASIPQNPSLLSPTLTSDTAYSQEKLKERQLYVLTQMEKNMDKINAEIKKETGNQEDALTLEKINNAKDAILTYQPARVNIKAPHFVFYVQKLLQQRAYNNGSPFTLNQIETDGLRIYTTLDINMQTIAEEQVRKAVDVYGRRYGASNAALMSINPKTGEILSMVGSYDYWGKSSPEGCKLGRNCKFDPSVNVLDTLQSYGSSMKPLVYYKALETGLISSNTYLPDVPININGYTPKNYEGGFTGYRSARKQLSDSRNIPAILLTDMMGVDNFVTEAKEWGYTTLNDSRGYGPAISVGGADVKLIDHAQAYTVLANGGNLVKHEVILKIEDKNGKVIYEHKPEPKQVADPRAVYIVNNILNGRNGGPGVSWDGRDVAGKTGTSEGQKETLFITYTPEIVVLGWLGNNNNQGMRYGASGFSSARPWISEYLNRVGGNFPKTPFPRPEGVIVGAYNNLSISGIRAPGFISLPKKYYYVRTVNYFDAEKKKLTPTPTP